MCFLLWTFLGYLFFKEEQTSILKKSAITVFTVGSAFVFLLFFLEQNCLQKELLQFVTKYSAEKNVTLIMKSSLKCTDIFLFLNFTLVFIYDFVEYSIPRFCSIALIPFFLFLILIGEWQIFLWEALFSSAFCFFSFFLIHILSKNKDGVSGLGEGDIELVTLLGLIFGERIGLIIFFSGLMGLLFYFLTFPRNYTIPFGSCLTGTSILFLVHCKIKFFPVVQKILNFFGTPCL